MMRGLTYMLVLLCVSSHLLHAQTGTDTTPVVKNLLLTKTVELKDVIVMDRAGNDGLNKQKFDGLEYISGKRLSAGLQEFSSVYVKNYGNGQLASLSVRGLSAAQTDILWNGVRINNSMLGQTDLSLITAGMQNNVVLTRSAVNGSIGGSLNLVNSLTGLNKVDAYVTAGSFKRFEALVSGEYGNDKIQGTTKFSYQTAKNNFRYKNLFEEGHPLKRQTNAAVSRFDFLQMGRFKLNDNNNITAAVWVNSADRQLPPLMSQQNGKESQSDFSIRAMAKWTMQSKGIIANVTSAYLYDYIRYKSPDADIDAPSATNAVRNKATISTWIGPAHLYIAGELAYDYEHGKAEAYNKARNLGMARVKAIYNPIEYLFINLNLRQDIMDKTLSPFAPSLSVRIDKTLKDVHRIEAQVLAARSFRFPTLNDLYWVPGGNRNLKTERSWSGELQAKYSYKNKIDIELSNFYMLVDNWIQWIPTGVYWSPVNVKRVFSRGIEANVHFTSNSTIDKNKPVFSGNVSYSYTKTTNLAAITGNDESKGKQLIYVPEHNITAALQLSWQRFYLRATNILTGARYITTDNSDYLPAYYNLDLELGKDFHFKQQVIGLACRLNNITGARYQNVAQRPMPGRNFEVMVRMHFKELKNE